MKSYSISLALILICSLVLAQGPIELNSSYNYVLGSRFTGYFLDTTGVKEGPAGANQTWNFSGITVNSSFSNIVVTPANTPFPTDYPSASVAVKAGDDPTEDEYFYYETNTGFITNWGYKSNSIGRATYTNGQKIYAYPFTYGSTLTDDFSGTSIQQGYPFQFMRKGVNNVVGDAYGSLVLNGANYPKVLRIKSIATATDSIFFGTWIKVSGKVTTFTWHAENIAYPVFTIMYTELTLGGTTQKQKFVNQYGPYIDPGAVSKSNEVSNLKLYPNPSSKDLTVSYLQEKAGLVNIVIMDLNGKELTTLLKANKSIGEHNEKFMLPNLPAGNYLIRIESEDKRSVKALVIK